MLDIQTVQQHFESLITGSVTVAFSGGADSALVLKLALDASQKRFPVYAVYVDTPWMTRRALLEARLIAKELGVELNVIRIASTNEIGIDQNPKDRCYHCKKAIFSAIRAFGLEHQSTIFLEGTQLDDLTKYRPGLKAVVESGAISPLKDLGLHKTEVRQYLAYLNLPVAQKPSGSCLATRIPYGEPLSSDILTKIEMAENFLIQFNLEGVRVRSHGDIARIEVNQNNFEKVISIRKDLIDKCKSLGWKYVTLDLEGFRSGSMD